jgi:hypothetical protein
LFCCGAADDQNAMGRATTPAFPAGWEVPLLHQAVRRAPPVVAQPTRKRLDSI